MNVGVIETAAGSMFRKFDVAVRTKRHGCSLGPE
jgi:hypothetical protein